MNSSPFQFHHRFLREHVDLDNKMNVFSSKDTIGGHVSNDSGLNANIIIILDTHPEIVSHRLLRHLEQALDNGPRT